MWRGIIAFLLVGCVGIGATDDMVVVAPTRHDLYDVATLQKITTANDPVHIYIEGDGHAFDDMGASTNNPTPKSRLVRDMAAADNAPNVAYIARPCQFVMDEKCNPTDWTTGRFSRAMVDSVASAIKTIVDNRPVILVGYSGGAMISGLIIQNHPELNIKKWITIAGVLNHSDWTQYFGDAPLIHSLNLNTLPRVLATHYVAEHDKVVPKTLSEKWLADEQVIVVPNATHGDIKIRNLNFSD